MRLSHLLFALLLTQCVTCKYAPPTGKTRLLVGQEYIDDFNSFRNATGVIPAGVSIYATLYSGALNTDSAALLSYIGSEFPNSYVEVGLSYKDALGVYGYDDCNINAGHGCYTIQASIDIANGKWDNSIDTFCTTLKKYPSLKYLIRLDYEVSNCFHANTDHTKCDFNSADWSKYPLAYNHIADRIRNHNQMTNVDFIYHAVRGQTQLLYPGSNYVDWIGLSVFNNDLCFPAGTTKNCEGQTVDPNIARDFAFAQSSNKPRIISESAPQLPVSSDDQQSAQYISYMLQLITKYDVGAWVYIHQNWRLHGWGDPWGNSLVNRDSHILSDWITNVKDNARFLNYDQ